MLVFRENFFLIVYHSESGFKICLLDAGSLLFWACLCAFYFLTLLRLCIFTRYFTFFRTVGNTSQFSTALYFTSPRLLLLKDHSLRWQLRPQASLPWGCGPHITFCSSETWAVLSIRAPGCVWEMRFARICFSKSFCKVNTCHLLWGLFICQTSGTLQRQSVC